MTQTTIPMSPGDDVHLTLLMAPQSLNLVTGQDREHLLAFGRAAFEAGKAIAEQGKCLHQIAEPAAAPFMYAIADGYGKAFFEEQGCVSSEAKDLQPEVDSLNRNLDGEPPYRVVALYTQTAQQMPADNGMYYLQDARWSGMVGNCPSFWRPDGSGYTTNLDEAGRFTHEEAMAQHRSRSTDLPWLCSEVDKLRRPTVDFQHMPRSWDAQRAALAAQAKQGGE